MSENDRVTVVDGNYNACQMKHVISQCDYFVGARTHSTIASLSSFVPTLSIAYSTKAYGINEDIFGHTDYVLSINELNESSLNNKFKLLYDEREKIQARLNEIIPTLKQKADLGAVYLKELLIKKGYQDV